MRNLVVWIVVFFSPAFPAFAQNTSQTEATVSGGPFVGGGGIFNLDRNTSDLSLEMGGTLDLRLREQLHLTGSLGFLANVSDNDAFDDRSLLATSGLLFRTSSLHAYRPFLTAGYAYANGERACHNFFYAGGGVRHWYGENIGWQLEIRDYVNGDLNFIQGRLSLLLR
jgi:hypothetical protein